MGGPDLITDSAQSPITPEGAQMVSDTVLGTLKPLLGAGKN